MNCKKCGRPLKAEEKKLCPACRADRDSIFKKIGEGVMVVGGIVWWILSKGKYKSKK